MNMDLRTVARTAVIAGVAVLQASICASPSQTRHNAILYVASIYIGPVSGALVGFSPWIAITGIMSLPLQCGHNGRNAAGCLRFPPQVQQISCNGLAAFAKFIVMTLGIRYLMAHGTQVPAPAYTSLTITQLITALAGAVVASIVLGGFERFGGNRHGSGGS